jgi:hypothetical protein
MKMTNEIMTNREMLEQAYEDATGLNARQGSRRIDNLESWIKKHGINDFQIFNDPQKMDRDYRKGKSWHSGKEHGDTICLGYTSARRGHKNAVFAQSNEIYLGE